MPLNNTNLIADENFFFGFLRKYFFFFVVNVLFGLFFSLLFLS